MIDVLLEGCSLLDESTLLAMFNGVHIFMLGTTFNRRHFVTTDDNHISTNHFVSNVPNPMRPWTSLRHEHSPTLSTAELDSEKSLVLLS